MRWRRSVNILRILTGKMFQQKQLPDIKNKSNHCLKEILPSCNEKGEPGYKNQFLAIAIKPPIIILHTRSY
jgi:predicted HicB family RNase H-like nuclease